MSNFLMSKKYKYIVCVNSTRILFYTDKNTQKNLCLIRQEKKSFSFYVFPKFDLTKKICS